VVVRPTNEQISNATEQFVFNSANIPTADEEDNTRPRCPITLENFHDGDTVTRIRRCGHTFQNAAITNWFNSNVRCPVCRYDIREWTEETPISNTDASGNNAEREPEETEVTSPAINSLINEITTGLNNAIQTYINTEYNGNEYNGAEYNHSYPDTALYTFTIPVSYGDGHAFDPSFS
jgi:hypothetical protein